MDDDKLNDFGMFAKEITRSILEHPKFSGLRSTTKWSELFSAWATRSLDELFDAIKDHAPEPQDRVNPLPQDGGFKGDTDEDDGEDEQDGSPEQTEDSSEASEQEGQGEDDSDIPEEGAEAQPQDGSGEEDSSKQNGYKVSDTAIEDINNAVDKFMDTAMEQVADAQKTQHSWGLDPGSGCSLKEEDVDYILNLLSLSEDSKRITDMVGRVQSILDGVETESQSVDGTTPTGYSLGDTIAKASPTDLAMLRHPTLKADVFRRAQEGGLQVMERTTPEPMGCGPCIALVDGSGSMTNYGLHGRELKEHVTNRSPANWAAAMAIALYKRAVENNQPFILHHFSGRTRSYRYDNPAKDYVEFLKHLMNPQNGGTEFVEPLSRTSKSLKEYPDADVVILSDCEIHPEWHTKHSKEISDFREAVELAEAKVIGVLIAPLTTAKDTYGSPGKKMGPLEIEKYTELATADNEKRMTPYKSLCDVAFQIDIDDVNAIDNITEQIFKEVSNG